MSNAQSILKMLKYAPMVLGLVQQYRGGTKQAESVSSELDETRQTLHDFRKHSEQRLDSLESEHTRLRTRLRELESSLTIVKALLYTSMGIALVSLISILIVLLR